MGSLFRRVTQTNDQAVFLVLRILLGIVIFAHGAQKMLGWFGGRGPAATIAFFAKVHHLPVELAVLPIIAEFFGPLCLFAGFLTRIAAFAIAVDMVVAVFLQHLKFGFFMSGKGGVGFEYHILAVAITIALMMMGAGRWSIDRLISQKR